jgi:hypothetical protein
MIIEVDNKGAKDLMSNWSLVAEQDISIFVISTFVNSKEHSKN